MQDQPPESFVCIQITVELIHCIWSLTLSKYFAIPVAHPCNVHCPASRRKVTNSITIFRGSVPLQLSASAPPDRNFRMFGHKLQIFRGKIANWSNSCQCEAVCLPSTQHRSGNTNYQNRHLNDIFVSHNANVWGNKVLWQNALTSPRWYCHRS